MKRIWMGVMLLAGALTLSAGELVLAEKGKSAYQLLLPDNATYNIGRELNILSKIFQRAFRESTGAELPVLRESQRIAGKKAIHLGPTAGAKKAAGPGQWKLNEYLIQSTPSGEIYLIGDDYDSSPAKYRNSTSHRLGSAKAGVEFLKRFCKADFLYPGPHGIYIGKAEKLVMGDAVKIRTVSPIQFVVGRYCETYYSLANDMTFAPWYRCYGGHSHPVAIPQAKYVKSHPEYFAIVYGKRNGYAKIPQYCLSNPTVREMIYQQLLKDVDSPGIEEAQLGQTDGFHACECAPCKAFLGKDPGAAIWKMHLDMADRLLKDRPGKRVRIIAYGPTRNPPKFRKVFPANTSVTIAIGHKITKEYLDSWKAIKVPYGFDIYLYNWGPYRAEGITPTFNLRQSKEQTALLRKYGVNATYLCGFMETPGLSCPVNLFYMRSFRGDDLDPDSFLKDYCFKVFGPKAGENMFRFYTLLYQRIEIGPVSYADYSNPASKAKNVGLIATNVRLLHERYPEPVLAKLEKELKAAEAAAPGNFMLVRTRREFDYLTLTARVCNLFYDYHAAPSFPVFEKIAKAVNARKNFIAKLPKLKNNCLYDGSDLPVLGGLNVKDLQRGGHLSAPLYAPFTWDLDYYVSKKISPSGRVMKADGRDFQQMVDAYGEIHCCQKDPAFAGCRVSGKDLEVLMRVAPAKDRKRWVWFVTLQKDEKSPCYQFTPYGVSVRTKTNAQNNDNGEFFEKNKELTDKYKARPTWKTLPNGDMELCIAIPLAFLGGKPAPGSSWNFGFVWWTGGGMYTWEYNLSYQRWCHRLMGRGKLIF